MKTLPDAKTLEEITRRIVKTANPQRVFLFGSAVRGELTPDSDLDTLVIVDEPVHRQRMAQKIYRNLHGVGIAVDIIVASTKDTQNYGDKNGSILKPALQEGRILYEI